MLLQAKNVVFLCIFIVKGSVMENVKLAESSYELLYLIMCKSEM